jgi:MYXO-CTERM domain-containing protein
MTRARIALALLVVTFLLVGQPPAARSVVSQIDGTIVPTTGDLQTELDTHETVIPLDAEIDAFTFPQIFMPPPLDGSGERNVTFTDIQEQAGFENSFGWYNVGDPSRLFRIFSCYPVNNEPDNVVVVDFEAELTAGRWDGGFVAFYIITPEDRPSGTRNCGDYEPMPDGSGTTNWFGHIYFTESEQNGDGDYVHNLVYSSKEDPNRFYFAFEDLFRGGDNDFTDFTIKVEGLTPPCTPENEVCDGQDNDCDGQVDEDLDGNALTRDCYTGPGGTQDVGICHGGLETCDSSTGTWGSCAGEQLPDTEVCDGLDNDCDGTADNNLTDTGQSCGSSVGQCLPGSTICTSGVLECDGETGPQPEECNGLDDDCDTDVDEGLGQTTCGLGVCNHTVDNCVSGVPNPCDPYYNAGTEVCDGDDNDCDGVVDGLQQVCYPTATVGCTESGGVWSCEGTCSTGIQDCPVGGAGTWGACQYATTPVAEICDNADNDCDGVVDDGLSQVCYPLGYGAATGCSSPTSCTGVCQVGSRSCTAGSWGACTGAVTPTPESCNNADDDCDGTVDGISRSCQIQNGFGTCTGTETCTAGAWGGCSAQTPAAETCNNADDDCDGAIDEGVTRSCYSGPTGTEGQGVCHAGSEVCTTGSWGSCQGEVTPGPEVCDGLDNDCDGDTDEDAAGNPLEQSCYSGAPGTEHTAPCHAGTRVCSGGTWGACQNEQVPVTEQCNGIDDDCDGDVDEGLGQTTCGLGECAHTIDNCVGGTPQTCDPYQGSQPEVCDGLDNDCNGVVDGLVRSCFGFASGCAETPPGSGSWSCEGACATGVQLCAAGGAGTWGACLYDVGPVAEACDGLDNDCDGDVDEDAAGNPLSQACYPPGAGPTTGCTAPSAGSWDCTGTCRAGQRTCVNAAWSGCVGHVTPTVEICDATDNDCDGDIDEPEDIPGLGQPCSTALGRCTPGVLQCENGQEICDGGAGPFPGECNAEDDDCDGEIDEPDEVAHEEGQPCGDATGVCEPGQTQCVGGSLQCVGGVAPGEEVCDGLDNDCDGQVDNQAECPPTGGADYYCIEGACRRECDATSEFPCPGSLTCQEASVPEGGTETVCLPAEGDCGGELCPEGWVCEDDQCVDPCDPNPCESWQECSAGNCVDVSCTAPGAGCPAGEFCVDHQCRSDPCEAAACDPAAEYCVRDCDAQDCAARCEPLCQCRGDERCDPVTGQCEPDPCLGLQCPVTERCAPDTGQCEPDPCAGVLCDGGQRCFAGDCVDDPCARIRCPAFYDCAVYEGESGPAAYCAADDAYWNPGTETTEFLATGAGGCQCGTGPAGPAAPLALLWWVLLAGALTWRRRRARAAARREEVVS